MGTIYGTCGHEVRWDATPVWWRSYGLEGPEYSYGVLCTTCRPGYDVVDDPYSPAPCDGFQRRVRAYYDECGALQTAKRNDYTAGLSPFYNYEKTAEVMGCSTGLAMLGRLNEKVIRLALALKGNKLQVNESILDSCRDISILAGLIALWLEDEDDEGSDE